MQSHFSQPRISDSLVVAIRNGQLDVVQSLVTSENIEAVDQHGYTALALAIWHGTVPMMKWLVQKGANLRFIVNSKEGPLKLAAYYGLEKLKYLLSLGLSVDEGVDIGESPLFGAVPYGRDDVAKYLLEHYPHMIEHKDRHGNNLLQLAALLGQVKLVTFLVAHYKEIIDANNSRALFYAVYSCNQRSKNSPDKNQLKIIKMLINAGAKVTPEIAASASKNTKVKCYLGELIGNGRFNNLIDKSESINVDSYPIYVFNIIRSNDPDRPFKLIIKKILSKIKIPENIFQGNISPNTPLSFCDELSDVSIKMQSNGSLVIESLADNVNYCFKTFGDVKTNNQIIKSNNANLQIECANFYNLHGKIAVKNFKLSCRKNLNNLHGEIEASKIHITPKGDVLNSHGYIVANDGDIVIQSQLKTTTIKTINGGRIHARKGKVITDVDKIITDESSRVRGKNGFDFNTNKLQQETTLRGDSINLSVSSTMDLHAGLLGDNVDIDKKKGKFNITHPILANKSRKIKLASPDSLNYDPKCLRSQTELELEFNQGGDLNKPLYNKADVKIKLSSTATAPLKINNHIITKTSKRDENKNNNSNISILTPTPLLFGNKKNLIQVRSLTGAVNMQASRMDIPFAAITSHTKSLLKTTHDLVVGDINNPDKTSELRSDDGLYLVAGAELKTNFNYIETPNFNVVSKSPWVDTASHIYVTSKMELKLPSSTHQIATEETTTPGRLTFNPAADYATTFTLKKKTAKKTSANTIREPIIIVNELSTTGKTHVIGGHITYKTQTKGEPPLASSFIETTLETGCFSGGTVTKHPWAYWHTQNHNGKVFHASSDMGTSSYESTELALPGNYRANALAIHGFNHLLIGDLANSRLPAIKPFSQIVDVMAEVQVPQNSLKASKNAATIFVDLNLRPKLPNLPRVIIQDDGFHLALEEKPLYPLAVEAKRVGAAFLKTIGQLPPEYNPEHLDLEHLHAELMQNTLEYFQIECANANPSLALVNKNTMLKKITKPLLVYKKIIFPYNDGSVVPGTVPIIVHPSSYEKYHLTAGNSLIANTLKLIGNPNSSLHITGKVHGNKHVEVEVSECQVETRLYHYQQKISQNSTTRKYGRKKKKCSEQIVTVAGVRERASLTSDGTLNIRTQKLIQRGSDISGNQGLVSPEHHIVEPVITSRVIPYADQAKICGGIVNKTKIWGEVLHTALVPSSFHFGDAMKLRAGVGEYSAMQAMSFTGNVDMEFTKGVSFKTVILPQPLIPTITKNKRTLTVGQGVIQQGYNNCLMSLSNSVLVSSDGYYHSEATDYLANKLIRLQAKNMNEVAVPLALTYHTNSSGINGLSYVHERTSQHQEAAIVPSYITGPQGRVEIIVSEEATIQAPQVKTSNLHIKAKDIKLLALSLRYFFEATRNTVSLNFMGASTIQALSQGNLKKAYQEFLKEFPVLDSMKELFDSKDLADLSMHGPKTFYHACKLYNAYQKAESFDEFIKGQFDLNPKLRFGYSTESSSQTKAVVPQLNFDEALIEAENLLYTEGLRAQYSKILQVHSNNIQMVPAVETKSHESSDDGFSIGISTKDWMPNVGFDTATHRFSGTYYTQTVLIGPVTELRATNDLLFVGTIEGSKARLSAKKAELYTVQDHESSNSSSFSFSTNLDVNYSKGSTRKLWSNTQTEIRMQDGLEIKTDELFLKGVKLSSKRTPVLIDTKKLVWEDVDDFCTTKNFSIGFSANGLINKESPFFGFVAPEFKRESHSQINRTFVEGECDGNLLPTNVSDNRIISSTKQHMGIFLPISNTADRVVKQKDEPSNLEGNAYYPNVKNDDQFIQVEQQESPIEGVNSSEISQDENALANDAPPTSLTAAPTAGSGLLSNFLDDIGHIPLLEPAIHTFEHAVVPTFQPSKQFRIGAALQAAMLKQELNSITDATRFIPDDPLKIFNSRNLLRLQRGLHAFEWGVGTFEGYHHLQHHGLSTTNAFAVSAISSGAAMTTNSLLSNVFFHSHAKKYLSIKYVVKAFGRSIATSSVATSVMEFVPNYFDLHDQNYSMSNSLVSSFLGTSIAVTTGTAGLWLIKTSVPMIGSGVGTVWGCSQLGIGTALVLGSGYAGVSSSKKMARLSHESAEYAANPIYLVESFDFRSNSTRPKSTSPFMKAMGRGIVQGVKGSLNNLNHPLDRIVYPLAELTRDCYVVSAVQAYENNLFPIFPDPHEYQYASAGNWLRNTERYRQSDDAIKARISSIKTFNKEFSNAGALKKTEIISSFVTGYYFNSLLLKGISQAGKLAKVAEPLIAKQLRKVTKFSDHSGFLARRDILEKMEILPSISDRRALYALTKNMDGYVEVYNNTIQFMGAYSNSLGKKVFLEFDKAIFSNPISAKAFSNIKSSNIKLVFDFTPSTLLRSNALGTTYSISNIPYLVKINLSNIPTLKAFVSTLVHENTHVERMLKGVFLNPIKEEYHAFVRSFLYLNGRKPSLFERNEIWKLVKDCYPDLDVSDYKPSSSFSLRVKQNIGKGEFKNSYSAFRNAVSLLSTSKALFDKETVEQPLQMLGDDADKPIYKPSAEIPSGSMASRFSFFNNGNIQDKIIRVLAGNSLPAEANVTEFSQAPRNNFFINHKK